MLVGGMVKKMGSKLEEIVLVRKYYDLDKWEEKRVLGKLIINGVIIRTLENRNYMVKAGKYKMVYEYSPRFKKNLWELKDVPGRTEIKIHNGRETRHSRGCILVKDVGSVHRLLDSKNEYNINIKNE